ncbi:distal tail protein Dit [Paenibacillus sp. M2]|uniref:distal tail protein Dit n=1 Tax=Paenibacillus sp. M2 TaxID=3341793 RepID=UPI0039897351
MIFNSVLTIDGILPSKLGLGVFRNTQRPILSSTVDNTVTIPGMHGAYDFGATMGPKQFELECAFIEKNHMELQRRASALAVFLLDGDGRPRTMDIVFSNSPDRKYSVRYVGSLNIDRISGLGTFKLPFTAFDPFAYSKQDTTELLTWDTDHTWQDDFAWGDIYEFGFQGSETVQINNFGTLNVEPLIIVTGSFSYLSLTIGGVDFKYNTAFNGTLEINYKRKTVKSGTQNVLQNTNAKFGKLPPGTSDLIVNGTNLNISVDVIFNAKYAA